MPLPAWAFLLNALLDLIADVEDLFIPYASPVDKSSFVGAAKA
jgi:hypothetical protein